jgi:FG-GAP-like repeat
LQLAGQIPIDAPDPSVILARDVNDDGKLDLIVVNAFSTVAILHGNGNGTFQNPQYFAAGFGLRSLSVADVNGDGTLDIATADEFFNEVSVCFGSSLRAFADGKDWNKS